MSARKTSQAHGEANTGMSTTETTANATKAAKARMWPPRRMTAGAAGARRARQHSGEIRRAEKADCQIGEALDPRAQRRRDADKRVTADQQDDGKAARRSMRVRSTEEPGGNVALMVTRQTRSCEVNGLARRMNKVGRMTRFGMSRRRFGLSCPSFRFKRPRLGTCRGAEEWRTNVGALTAGG